MKLDISAFERVIGRLSEGLARYDLDRTDIQIRDGLIQRFEFTYDLAHKMLRRYLEWSGATTADYDTTPFADLIRAGNRQGLLQSDWPLWRQFREMRNITSHTYDEAKAVTVVAAIPAFLAEASFFRDQLKRAWHEGPAGSAADRHPAAALGNPPRHSAATPPVP